MNNRPRSIIYFVHGKESGPWGTKFTFLAKIAEQLGWEVESPDFREIPNPDRRASILYDLLEPGVDRQVLVGSSMGGYAALVASSRIQVGGVFLLAPALYLPGYQVQAFSRGMKCPIEIVHGWRDDIVPPEHSIRFAQTDQIPLHLIDDDHRLSGQLDTLGDLFVSFLGKQPRS